jgi:hypothetical protein
MTFEPFLIPFIFYIPNFLKKVPIVAAASHSNDVYPFFPFLLAHLAFRPGELLSSPFVRRLLSVGQHFTF